MKNQSTALKSGGAGKSDDNQSRVFNRVGSIPQLTGEGQFLDQLMQSMHTAKRFQARKFRPCEASRSLDLIAECQMSADGYTTAFEGWGNSRR